MDEKWDALSPMEKARLPPGCPGVPPVPVGTIEHWKKVDGEWVASRHYVGRPPSILDDGVAQRTPEGFWFGSQI